MMKPLLIPLTYFCLQTWQGIPQAKCQVQLSMMDDAFDDQYLGCAKEMDTEAHKLLKEEMTPPFSTVWQKATETWKNMKSISRPRGFKDEYGIAIVAYTNDTKYNGKTFSSTFNDAVSGTKRSRAASMANFKFKAFHYYLTRVLQFLRGKCNVMYNKTVYRGTQFQYTGSGKIRFGFFASSSISRKVAEDFGTGTIFTIRMMCLDVDRMFGCMCMFPLCAVPALRRQLACHTSSEPPNDHKIC
ncbi:T-cell ecto-ADP-ribosyltransferase 2-like [Mauremys reevesii]|uniref:T-cell ecto-ADP-ribosyltransferase 2-like n=1 Tax=Mauremys reevesii TaxID=260615 RepID=UPI00193FDF02|nr:T-cell ecto-ADP-ribosyltransferase 2-like [Mauremys reevesii]